MLREAVKGDPSTVRRPRWKGIASTTRQAQCPIAVDHDGVNPALVLRSEGKGDLVTVGRESGTTFKTGQRGQGHYFERGHSGL